MEGRVEMIKSWLDDEQSNVLSICGMGGSGKTTLAQYIYNLKKQDFNSSAFIQEIGKQPHGLLGLQKQLLKDVSGGKKIKISSVSEGTYKIEQVLQTKKVLIVLDDIDKHQQLSALLGTKAFVTNSKIIITTRLLDIKALFGSISLRCRVHKTRLLNELESLELLSWYAFRSKTPMKGFKDLALLVAKYCGGIPLALQVLGSSLFVSDEGQRTRNRMIEIWKSRMNSLNSLKGNLDCDIQDVLQKSFDSLPLQSDKELFLHIACFFIGHRELEVTMILENELHAKSGIFTLINRCLLSVSSNGHLMMHQLLQEMGKRIVFEEAKDPAKRSRVWCDTESYNVLRKKDGSDTIEGLALDMRKIEQGTRSEILETSSLVNMEKLILLQLKYVKLTGEKFPKLIWLCWHGCPLKAMPSGLLMSSLVAVDLSYGDMEMFDVPKGLNSLKILQLKGCEKLVSIRNLYRIPKLEGLSLWNCNSLTHICETIRDLKSLVGLDMKGCTKLWKYPAEQPLLSFPRSLLSLDLAGSELDNKSDVRVAFHTQSFFFLCLGCNLFEFLPNNIVINLRKIQVLNLYGCSNLKSLPSIPSTLQELYIDWCTSLKRITFELGRFSLRGFSCEGCLQLFEVQGLFNLVPIAKVHEADLVQQMQWIKAYEHHKLALIGDEITNGRIWFTQMLHEYGIMSTYVPSIKDDQRMLKYDYTSSTGFLNFLVPCHDEKNKIQGLSISCLYRSLVSMDKDWWPLWAKINNKTKGLTWIYNPAVYCKPKVDEDVMWLSYWPIGNILDAGDKVSVDIFVEEGMMKVGGCSASLVYMESGVKQQENIAVVKEKEVIGGDLSEFMVTKGGYYLCRRNIFNQKTAYWLKWMFGDNVYYAESQGWRKTHDSLTSRKVKAYVKTFMKIIEVGVSFNSETEIANIEKVVSSLEGVESVSADKEMGKLIVTGCVSPVEVVTCVREFGDMLAEILSVKTIVDLKDKF